MPATSKIQHHFPISKPEIEPDRDLPERIKKVVRASSAQAPRSHKSGTPTGKKLKVVSTVPEEHQAPPSQEPKQNEDIKHVQHQSSERAVKVEPDVAARPLNPV